MGKGDKKSRRGKIFMGSFGITRPKNKKKFVVKPSSVSSEAKEKAKKAKVIPEVVIEEPVPAVIEPVQVMEVEKADKTKKAAPKKESAPKAEVKKVKEDTTEEAGEVKAEKEKKVAKKTTKKE